MEGSKKSEKVGASYLWLVNFIQRISKSHSYIHSAWWRHREVWFYLVACSRKKCMIFFQLHQNLIHIIISYCQNPVINANFNVSAIEIGCLNKSIPNWWNILGFVSDWITKRKIPDIDQSILFSDWRTFQSRTFNPSFMPDSSTSYQRVIRRESKNDSYSKDLLFLAWVTFCVITFEPIMI